MKIIIKQCTWILVLALIIGNVYIFINGMQLANNISYFESQTKKLHLENLRLEKKVSAFDSYSYAASMAAKLDFTNKAAPMFLDNLKYALNR